MKIYHCGNCNYPVYFENVVCSNCRQWLGYDSAQDRIVALLPDQTRWQLPEYNHTTAYCANHAHNACNWLVEADRGDGLCTACELNQTIPDLSDPVKLEEWQQLELAKHRLVYALLRLGLPIESKMDAPDRGLAFDFLADDASGQRVMTGHDDGLITLNVEEADSVNREATRIQMHEKYRTLIGHFRHEVGHYYWDRLVDTSPTLLAEFRQLFGDERADYGEALQQHYRNGPPADWPAHFISEYATTHPWEDWAETWAHYLHLMDLVETAHAFGMSINPANVPPEFMGATADFDPYVNPNADRLLRVAVPITFAVNSLNRGMGRKDLYPFVVNASVREKLSFVDRVMLAGKQLPAT